VCTGVFLDFNKGGALHKIKKLSARNL
jgi:hypothetical protein